MSRRKILWFGTAAILIFIAIAFYKFHKYPFINSKIAEVVGNKTDSLYKISYDSISVKELQGDLFIHNLHIQGDTLLQKQFILNNDSAAASVLLDIFIPELKVGGFKTAKALLSNQLACDNIIISNPRVTVYVYPGRKKNVEFKNQGEEIYKQLLGKYKLIQADSVSVMNAAVVMVDFKSKEKKFKTFNTSVNLHDLRIDSTHNYYTSRTLFCKEIFVHTDKVVIGDERTSSEVTNLTFNTRDKILNIGGLSHDEIKTGSSLSSTATNVSITGIEAAGAIDSMNLVVGKIFFKNASIKLKGKGKSTAEIAGQKLLTGWVKSIKVKHLQTDNLSLKILAANPKKNDLIVNSSILNLKEVNIDASSRMDASLLKSVGEIILTNNLVSFKSNDNLYHYNFGGVYINSRKKKISLKDFSVVPLLGEASFAKTAMVQKDRYNISVKNLVCSEVNFDSLVRGSFYIGLIKTSGNFVKIYRDISYPLDSISKVGKHPHQAISKMEMPINIKKILASNTLIEYKEKNGLSDTSGAVTFERSNISITNITNLVSSNQKMDASIATNFLGQIPLNAAISFKLDNISNGFFTVTGSIKNPFNGQILNPSILPMGLVKIDKGNINSVDFNFTGDNYSARGLFVMKYNDLKMSLYEKARNKKILDKKNVTSVLANIIVRNANPSNKKLRQANIVYRRNDYKSFFNMVWKFMFTGVKDVIGAKF